MKVSGTTVLRGPVETVYAVLNDPAVLVRTIPGCERLEQVRPDMYKATVTAGVASIRGSFSGEVHLTDQRAPHSFVLRAAGSGAPGTVAADVAVTLADDGTGLTLLSYDADAVVGGMVGGVGQRVLAGVARKTADDFFAAVDAVLTGAEAAAGVPAPVGAAPAPAVFTRPPGAPGPALGVRPGGGFAIGVAVGAGIALLGALVGGLVAGRAARRR
jgi:carbon monoxide dehydrogenase subunit G